MEREQTKSALVNEKEAAAILGVALQTVRNWRGRRVGPSYVKYSSAVRYDLRDLQEYIRQHRIVLGEN